MLRFLIRRLLHLTVVALGAISLVFVLSRVVPADPARAALGPDASEQQIKQYRHELGLDKPLLIQFGGYVQHLLRGDLGISIITRDRVTEDLGSALPATIELVVPSVFLSLLLGMTLGAVSAVWRGQAADHVSRLTSVLGMSLPVFWFGLVLQLIFYRYLGWFPAGGRLALTASQPHGISGLYTVDGLLAGEWGVFLDALRHLVLPVITLSTVHVATVARFTRGSLLEVLGKDYVRTARSKGLPDRIVLRKHSLRNALIPIVTVFGLEIGTMLGGAVLTESIFSWPGIGRYALLSLVEFDVPVVLGLVVYMTLVYTILNVLVDVSYSLLDPRIRYA